jgi:hypothetical protein
MQVIACAVVAFQADHEDSMPFARSNPKPQVRDLSTGDKTKQRHNIPALAGPDIGH